MCVSGSVFRAGFFSVPFVLSHILICKVLGCLPSSCLFLMLVILPGQLRGAPQSPWEHMDQCPVIRYFLGSRRLAEDQVWEIPMLWISEGLCHLKCQMGLRVNLTLQAPACVKKN